MKDKFLYKFTTRRRKRTKIKIKKRTSRVDHPNFFYKIEVDLHHKAKKKTATWITSMYSQKYIFRFPFPHSKQQLNHKRSCVYINIFHARNQRYSPPGKSVECAEEKVRQKREENFSFAIYMHMLSGYFRFFFFTLQTLYILQNCGAKTEHWSVSEEISHGTVKSFPAFPFFIE